jgi:hypothetical protein
MTNLSKEAKSTGDGGDARTRTIVLGLSPRAAQLIRAALLAGHPGDDIATSIVAEIDDQLALGRS